MTVRSISPASAADPGVQIDAEHPLFGLVSEAWEVFPDAPPPSLGVCRDCCMDPGIEEDFRRHAPRDLPIPYLWSWYAARPADDLDHGRMGWLLPRVLECLALNETAFPDGEETALSRLPAAGFPDAWPPASVDLVMQFCHAWLALRVADRTLYLDETLCTVANSGLPVGDFLGDLWALPTPVLAQLMHDSFCSLWGGRMIQTPNWVSQDARTQVWNWYVSCAMETRMAEAGLAGFAPAAAMAELIRDTLKAPVGA